MKSDNYLTLCLEQAAKSPLHYRHGAIIVRGGKVIGKGHNDYRPGFDGGALKHGHIARAEWDGTAIKELKAKLKKGKGKQQQQTQQNAGNTSTFTPFGGTGAGGGHAANSLLSMHSEMMAIHSALASSSTLSSTAFSHEKPCFKLPHSGKRKARLRRAVLESYVNAICADVSEQKPPHLNAVHYHANNHNNKAREDKEDKREEQEKDVMASRRHEQLDGVQHLLSECHRAFHVPLSGGKDHRHQKRKEKEGMAQQYGGQIQYGGQQQRGFVSKRSVRSGRRDNVNDDHGNGYNDNGGARYDSAVDDVITGMSKDACTAAEGTGRAKGKKDYKRSGKMKISPRHDESLQPEILFLPKGQTRPSTADRKKNPRLIGADLYVARLGWNKRSRDGKVELASVPIPTRPPSSPSTASPEPDILDKDELESSLSSLSNSTSSTCTIPTTSCSLHDELLNPTPSPSHTLPSLSSVQHRLDPGIKRVFWTSDDGIGGWEGGKVAGFVGMMDESLNMVDVGGAGERGVGLEIVVG
ncbi:hypothetical protein LTR62_007660 [Meristemomyces frigidus]|uniref:CMP/dCMP-type deaminase domain-containing protein n=1 Tax=Meristemomyces frigidus TaxID=1508187 RepID=A0AAN7TBR2_9PEZI|nr:hypothetical protein LTR62_007660 [Meristemomyces frigidus]